MSLDPISDFLRIMDARSVVSGGLITGGAWAIDFPAADRIKFWGVTRGCCWLAISGESEPIRVEQGDVFLLCAPKSHILGSNLAIAPANLQDILDRREGAIARHGEGDDFFMIGGKVELGAEYGALLLQALPPLIHIRASSKHALALHWLLDQLVHERENEMPGGDVASAQLAHLMFIHILRAHFEAEEPKASGWLKAASDKRLAPALKLIHGDPGRSWQLEELAKASAMSRAAFASYFKDVAGIPPITYLTEWRMRLAQRALRNDRVTIAKLAASLGYSSESAFSNAFKRVTGNSPKSLRMAVTQ